MSVAIVVVDVQNDFTENGSLAVAGGDKVALNVGAFIAANKSSYDVVATTQDFHIEPGEHFASPGTDPDFMVSWPVHCVADSEGAALDPLLDKGAGQPFANLVDVSVYKGHYAAAYSGFEGVVEPRVSQGFVPESGDLTKELKARGVTRVDVVGIATDYCVKATALDAVKAGFSTRVLLNMCAGVGPQSTLDAIDELTAAGVQVVN